MDLESGRRFGQQKLDIIRSREHLERQLAASILAHGTPEQSHASKSERSASLRKRYNDLAEKISTSIDGNRVSPEQRQGKGISYHDGKAVPMKEDEPDGDRLGVELHAQFDEFGPNRRPSPKYIKAEWYVLPKTSEERHQPALPLETEELWGYQVGQYTKLDEQERVMGLLEKSVNILVGESVTAEPAVTG